MALSIQTENDAPEAAGPTCGAPSRARRSGDHAPQTLHLLRGVMARGLPLQPLLVRAGIDVGRVPAGNDAAALQALSERGVRDVSFVRLLREVRRQLGDEFFGLASQPCRLGTEALAMETALHLPTLEAVVQWLVRYYRVVTDVLALSVEIQDNEAALGVALRCPEADPDRFLEDYWLLWLHRMLSWLADRHLITSRIERRGNLAGDATRLASFVRAPWRSHCARDALVLYRRDLALPVLRTQAQWQEMRALGAAGLLSWPQGNGGWRLRVRELLHAELVRHERNMPQNEVAQRLGTSAQTLRRQLLAESVCFQDLRDELRRDLAKQLLREARLPVADVAARLGFAEPRSFTRAFRTWTGYSPVAWLATEEA